MPLVLLFGEPNSGKTAMAHQLQEEYLRRAADSQCLIVSPDTLGFSVEQQISQAADLHKQMYSFVQRNLNQRDLLIVDYTNHTKSYRYQLFCVAREKQTRFCIMVVEAGGAPGGRWTVDAWENMRSRTEELLDKSEWDNPHFDKVADVVDYVQQLGVITEKKSTQPRKLRNYSLGVFLNLTFEKILVYQQTFGLAKRTQIYDGVYVQLKQRLDPAATARLKQDFTAFYVAKYKGESSNRIMASVLKEWLEK